MSDEIENVEQTQLTEEVVNFDINTIGMVESDDEIEESESIATIDDINDINAQYNKSKINHENVVVNSAGEVVDPSTLSILDRLKISAKHLGQTLDDPDPSCKKCYGRGYTGINLDGNLPQPCNCLYKTFFKTNPEYRGQQMPSWNRKMKRRYDKDLKKYVTLQAVKARKQYEIIEKSKDNLGKNTPGFVKKADTIIDFAELTAETTESETNE